MKFAVISPIVGLERYSTLSDTHLVLSHVTSSDYCRFYKARREAGDFLILDNGAYENKASHRDFLVALNYYRPQVAVLPDTINNPIKTGSASLRFLDNFAHLYPDVEWMYMLHRNKEAKWYNYFKVLDDPRVGHLITWVGFPRCLVTDHELSRVDIAKDFPGYKRHAFGMADGNVNELRELAQSGLFQSCDSSAPVWRGWNGWSVSKPDHRTFWQEHGTSVDFYAGPSGQDAMILANLKECNVNIQRNSTSSGR